MTNDSVCSSIKLVTQTVMSWINKYKNCLWCLVFLAIGYFFVPLVYITYASITIHTSHSSAVLLSSLQLAPTPSYTERWQARRQELLAQGGRKKVVLFCYMRGGSTFFSELFRHNLEVMYWYEPYDAFYSAEFGEKTWHFPQDIFWYQHEFGNSELRKQPDWELEHAAWFNHNMLSCNFSSLPVELFYHHGLGMSNLVPFSACLREQSSSDPQNCRTRFIPQCTGNSKAVFDNMCPQKIKQAREFVTSQLNGTLGSQTNGSGIGKGFIEHARCNSQFPKWIDKCVNKLEEKCNSSKMVTYKGLRITMTAVERMLQLDPDLHVVYFVRDPRGTVTSRRDIAHTYRDTRNSAILESKYHCAKMMADLRIYERLIKEFPNSILLVKYEDVTLDPFEEIKRIYRFYGMDVHQSVFDWMERNEESTVSGGVFSTSRANASASIDKWRRKNPPNVQVEMTEHCKEVLEFLNYKP